MTNLQELQQLSREAARKLPEGVCIEWRNGVVTEGSVFGTGIKEYWLHESTEACVEIMVRVLWPKGWSVKEDLYGACAIHWEESIVVKDTDPMQAFRTAVLRAVVAL